MPSIKLITKVFVTVAMFAVVFGPFGVLQQTQTAHAQTATCSDTTPGAYYQSGTGVLGQGQWVCPSTNSAINASTGKPTSQAPSNNTDCSGITGCLASMVYYIGPGFASWVASWAAYFFDFVVRISLSSSAYALTFLATAWTTVLSLANMFFIFILIYAALVIMLRADTTRTMQTLAWVIAIALIVNFSFFFTRVVIDAGNILGTQFYNAVAFQQGVGTLKTGDNSTAPATPDITAPIMQALGIEQLLGSNSFALAQQNLGTGSWGTLLVLSVIYLAAAVMFWILALALLMVGIKFFIRIVGLWLVLIVSPLAFVAQTLSNTRHFFSMWLRTLVSLAFYPAIFLFMFWILNQFVVQLAGGTGGLAQILTTNAVGQAVGAAGSATATANPYPLLTAIANISIRMMFVVAMLYVMLKVADWVMEQMGGLAATVMSRGNSVLLGTGLRTAASAGAFFGRNTVGRAAFRAAESGALKGNTGLIGNSLWRGAARLSRSTFDLRNTAAPNAARSVVGNILAGRGTNRSFSSKVDERAGAVVERAKGLQASAVEVRTEEGKFKRESRDRIAQLNNQVEQAKLRGDTKIEKEAMAEIKTIQESSRKVGEARAQEAAKARIAQFAQRIGGRNLTNAGLPSMGSVKGAAAAMKLSDRIKPGDTRRQTPANDNAGAAGPAPHAPAGAAHPANDNERLVHLTERIARSLEHMEEQNKERSAHVASALHAIPDATKRLGHDLKKGFEDLKTENKNTQADMEAMRKTFKDQLTKGANEYEKLGLKQGASLEEVKAAFKTMAKTLHPDQGGDTESMQALNDVYEKLEALFKNNTDFKKAA